MPPILQITKFHQKANIYDFNFGGLWCFSDLVAKKDFSETHISKTEIRHGFSRLPPLLQSCKPDHRYGHP